jgi:DNA-directed RNA polymerase subunit beta'
VSRSGEIAIADDHGRERERYKLPYGAVISVAEGDAVEAGQVIAQWDPHTHPIVTEVAGVVRCATWRKVCPSTGRPTSSPA